MKTQKRLAAQLLGVSQKKVVFDQQRLADIKESITKTDIRRLIADKAITKRATSESSKSRARKLKAQKSKGLRKGKGSREGKKTARLPRKESWMAKIRSQRKFITELRKAKVITNETYRNIYMKAKGGFFRSTRHIKIYLGEHKLFIKSHEEKKAVEPKPDEKKAVGKEKVKPAKKAAKKKIVKKKAAKKKTVG